MTKRNPHTFDIPPDVLDAARDLCAFEGITLNAFAVEAMREAIGRRVAERGEPFPPRSSELKATGRPPRWDRGTAADQERIANLPILIRGTRRPERELETPTYVRIWHDKDFAAVDASTWLSPELFEGGIYQPERTRVLIRQPNGDVWDYYCGYKVGKGAAVIGKYTPA